MVLTNEDKARVGACWAPVSKNPELYGAESLTMSPPPSLATRGFRASRPGGPAVRVQYRNLLLLLIICCQHASSLADRVSVGSKLTQPSILPRLFANYPATKPNFHHSDLSPGSIDPKTHSKKVIDALTEDANNLDDVEGALSKLRDLHAQTLRVDPVNFKRLNHLLKIIIAAHNGGPLKAEIILSLDNFWP